MQRAVGHCSALRSGTCGIGKARARYRTRGIEVRLHRSVQPAPALPSAGSPLSTSVACRASPVGLAAGAVARGRSTASGSPNATFNALARCLIRRQAAHRRRQRMRYVRSRPERPSRNATRRTRCTPPSAASGSNDRLNAAPTTVRPYGSSYEHIIVFGYDGT